MSFKEELPIWLNPGQKPPQPKIEEGYQPMDHPPADWFNWYQHSVYRALKEIQEIAATNQTVTNLNEKVDKHTALRNNPHGVTKTQIGLSNVDNVKQASKAEFDDHASNKENPHWVTKNQVGLGNVDNVRQASKAEFDDHKNNTSNPHSVTKAQVGLGNVDNVQQAPKKEFDDHKNSTSNPHSVTKAQVGLGNVPNWGGATQAEAQAGTNNAKIMTPLRTKEAIDVHGDDLKKHITMLDTNIFSAETDAKDYPIGISYFYVDSNSQKFPAQHVFVTTIKEVLPGNQFRLFQTVQSVGVDYGRIWTRGTRSGAWGPWEEWETTDGAQQKINVHEAKKNNPHNVTKAQVGLGNVPNWGGASQTEARGGTNNSTIMTPLRTKEAIEALASEATIIPAIAGTVSGNDYPLGITTFQHSNLSGYPTNHGSALNIKLSNLRCAQFYVPHARTEADTGVYFRHFYGEEGWTDFWQVETTAGAQAKVNAHANDKGNPHGTTKAQVGLGNVDNVKQAPKADFDAFVARRDNPHNVTKSQVGLGNVQDWIIALESEARAGTSTNRYMTPERTKQAIESLHANNKNNPHGVTKSQVGLGNVANYPIASQAQAEAGNHTESFMTPQRVRQFAAKYGPDYDEFNGIATGLGSHTSNKSNPHGVTKAQVGLGNVPNWGGATQAEAQAGTNNAKIMTPLRTKEAFNKFFTDQDTGWITLALHSYLQPQGTSPRVRRIGNTVHLEGTFKNVLDTDILITVLPDEFRPGRSLTFPTTGQVGHGTVFVTRIDVQSNGRVLFIRSSRQGHGEYEPENWYNLDGIIYTV